METKKIKVRIALVVNGNGNYNASGRDCGRSQFEEYFDVCSDGLGGVEAVEDRYVVEVEVDLPKYDTNIIEGTAIKQTED